MKNEPIKEFVVKITLKIIIFVLIVIGIAGIVQAVSPVISNELALTQMQNSDEMYILVNTYNKIRSIANIAYAGVAILLIASTAYDTYKFVKSIKASDNVGANN